MMIKGHESNQYMILVFFASEIYPFTFGLEQDINKESRKE